MMMGESFPGMFRNAVMLLSVAFIFDLAESRLQVLRWSLGQAAIGFALGTIGIIVMLTPWTFGPGVVFDTRSILLGISGLFFGFFPTVAAMAMTTVFRIYQGGAGVWTGVAVILASGAIGIAWRRFRRPRLTEISGRELLFFGIVIHVVMLGLMLTLPRETSSLVLSQIALPVMLIYPPGTALLGALMTNRLRREQMEGILRDSENRYRSVFDNSIDAVLLTSPDGRILAANPEACRIFGRTEGEICRIGRAGLMDLTDPRLARALQERERTGQYRGELTFIRSNGETFPGEVSSVVFKDHEGRIRTSMIVRDITERKQAEAALRNAEIRYHMFFEHSPDGIVIIDPATARLLEFNETAYRQLGYSRAEFANLSISDLDVDETPEETRARMAKVLKDCRVNFETRQRTRQGEIRNVHVKAQTTEISGKQVYLCIWRDITERKKAEEALARSEEVFRKTFFTSPDAVNINRLEDGMYVSINPGFTGIMGYTEWDIIGKSSIELNIWADIGDRQRLLEGLKKDGKVANLEAVFRTKDGSARYGLMSASMIDLNGVPHIISITRDITDRKRVEESLRESEETMRYIVQHDPNAIAVYDRNLRYIAVSNRYLQDYGVREGDIIGKHHYEVFPEMPQRWREVHTRCLDGAIERNDDDYFERPDGSITYNRWECRPWRRSNGEIGGIITYTEVTTERKKAEIAIRESERKFRTLTENTPDIIARLDREGRHLFINKAIEKFTNMKTEDYLGKTNEEMGMPEESLALWNQRLRNVFETAGTVHFEFDFPSPDGVRTFFSTLVPEFDEKGKVSTVLVLARDITHQKESMEKLRKTLGATVHAIAVTVETRDPYTAGHQRGVADLARAIATEMNLSSDRIDGIRTAATLHDLGKISVPAEILSKPTRLTKIEYEIIKTHAQSGYDILREIEFPWPIARMVLEHHERMDGSGYPNGLKSDQLLLESRILIVADVVESMASHRPYRAGLGIDAALEEIEENRGILYDESVVDACLRLFREKRLKHNGHAFQR